MNLKAYFSETAGSGVLSTADGQGRVDAAIYARPHIMEDGTVAMIMRDRLSHKNLQENPYAAYLFREDSPGYRGVRLFLKKEREDDDPELISQLTRRWLTAEEDKAKGPKFLVYFKVEKVLSLIGGDEL
ncbi:Pyridoxamine 5'-phosphate oxidase [Malonomonas rubra DSM 5091]|uniref:Pyridoxamine 5'-phosphate oxidase n=1 Tax=Malonomonas rubra DSM 5091 TaxID=1122189 RepID=A0A1M6G3K2_MALRU|nr:pyridoxamine 5'-phosphate oxidase family protein [Malonomonas rubra]SHJ04555.1 Pyridoxamine 5'-phosphate oxidase [Malonomonas rubra DSM 5091]